MIQTNFERVRAEAEALRKAADNHEQAAKMLFHASWLRNPGTSVDVRMFDRLLIGNDETTRLLVTDGAMMLRVREFIAAELEREAASLTESR